MTRLISTIAIFTLLGIASTAPLPVANGTESAPSISSNANASVSGTSCRAPQPQPPFLWLSVRRVSCAIGRKVARSYLFDRCQPRGSVCVRSGFRCREKRVSYEAYRVYCARREGKVVAFKFGF